MKASRLIELLTEFAAEHGDLDVEIPEQDGCDFYPIGKVAYKPSDGPVDPIFTIDY